MRKIYTIGLAICCGTAAINATETGNSSNVITLDLTKAATDLRFNEENGAWEGTYDDEEVTIDSQCFTFIHSSISDYATWWGFTAIELCRQQASGKHTHIPVQQHGRRRHCPE